MFIGNGSHSNRGHLNRQRCAINKKDNNKVLNIVLIALAAVLVLAVVTAVGMAGRIRKQEQAGQSAPAEVTAGAAEGEPEGPGEAKTGQAEASSGSGASEETAKNGSAGSGSLTEDDAEGGPTEEMSGTDAVPANSEGGSAEEVSGTDAAPADAGSGSTEDGSTAGTDDTGSGTKAPFVKTVHVEVDGKTVLETPLTGESKYAIIDGRAVELEVETTLADMQGLADPANHDVNLIYIHDGKVSCSESNCENQVCVHTGELTGSAFDLPIICLPHGVVVQVTD